MDKEKKSEIHITNNFNAPIGQHIDHVDTINFRMDGDGNFHFGMVENVKEGKKKNEEEGSLPKELLSNRARGMLNRAVDEGLLTEDYQPSEQTKKWQLACMADCIGDALELNNKWIVFGSLWGSGNNLRKYKGDKQGLSDYNNFEKKIKRSII